MYRKLKTKSHAFSARRPKIVFPALPKRSVLLVYTHDSILAMSLCDNNDVDTKCFGVSTFAYKTGRGKMPRSAVIVVDPSTEKRRSLMLSIGMPPGTLLKAAVDARADQRVTARP